jgi:hypothetical protein
LGLDLVIESVGDLIELLAADLSQDADENLLEALEVPVLVNASVNDSGGEHLLGLEGEQVPQVVHISDSGVIREVLRDEVRE